MLVTLLVGLLVGWFAGCFLFVCLFVCLSVCLLLCWLIGLLVCFLVGYFVDRLVDRLVGWLVGFKFGFGFGLVWFGLWLVGWLACLFVCLLACLFFGLLLCGFVRWSVVVWLVCCCFLFHGRMFGRSKVFELLCNDDWVQVRQSFPSQVSQGQWGTLDRWMNHSVVLLWSMRGGLIFFGQWASGSKIAWVPRQSL